MFLYRKGSGQNLAVKQSFTALKRISGGEMCLKLQLFNKVQNMKKANSLMLCLYTADSTSKSDIIYEKTFVSSRRMINSFRLIWFETKQLKVLTLTSCETKGLVI